MLNYIVRLTLLFVTWKPNITHGTTDPEINIFKPNFKFGASTAAYQIEGGWNVSGKGLSNWDYTVHRQPEIVSDGSNGDIGANSYFMYEEDIRALKETKLDFYRFSMSWSRILPDGDISSLNADGLLYYNRLINRLLENSIEPIVTMHHFDLPQKLEELGGFLNEKVVDYFEQYANVLFAHFGDRVKRWITINEPYMLCTQSYSLGAMPPLTKSNGVGEYYCADNVLKAHAKVYHLYRNKYYESFKGKIGISLNVRYAFSDNSTVSERAIQFSLGWFGHPIFSENGDYPKVMRDAIDENSLREGRVWSRLPVMTEEWRNMIKGSADYLGINYYTSRIVQWAKEPVGLKPSLMYDSHLAEDVDPKWKQSAYKVMVAAPDGFLNILRWIKDQYNNPEVIITENGWPDRGEINDSGRVELLKSNLNEVQCAVNIDGCNITGYSVWSLIDSFEWNEGYSIKFGLYSIENATFRRIPKTSARFIRSVIESRKLDFNASNFN